MARGTGVYAGETGLHNGLARFKALRNGLAEIFFSSARKRLKPLNLGGGRTSPG